MSTIRSTDKKTAIAVAVTFAATATVGGIAFASLASQPPQTITEVKTVTEYVVVGPEVIKHEIPVEVPVEKIVEVPGPTVTEYVEVPGPVQYVEKIVEVPGPVITEHLAPEFVVFEDGSWRELHTDIHGCLAGGLCED